MFPCVRPSVNIHNLCQWLLVQEQGALRIRAMDRNLKMDKKGPFTSPYQRAQYMLHTVVREALLNHFPSAGQWTHNDQTMSGHKLQQTVPAQP